MILEPIEDFSALIHSVAHVKRGSLALLSNDTRIGRDAMASDLGRDVIGFSGLKCKTVTEEDSIE